MAADRSQRAKDEADGTSVPPPAEAVEPKPWEQIENGRYMPRRIRGSCLGRELG